MKRNLTASNVDNYIREQMRIARLNNKKRKFFKWDKDEWSALSAFVWACTCDVFRGDKGFRLKEGTMFMGVRHFKKKK